MTTRQEPGRWSGRRAGGRRLRLLSYNIQAGLATGNYGEYVTGSWRYLLPHPHRQRALQRMARLIAAYDLVGLQETDAGSMRTSFVNQTEFLARHSGLRHWYDQVNQSLGAVARHSNGLLARFPAHQVRDCKLPGAPGRGLLVSRFGREAESLVVLVAHLALGRRARERQFEFIAGVVREAPHVVLMGDFNCGPDSPELRKLLATTGLGAGASAESTFPSWCPSRRLDHILVSPGIEVLRSYVPAAQHSDHLPVAMEVVLPPQLELAA